MVIDQHKLQRSEVGLTSQEQWHIKSDSTPSADECEHQLLPILLGELVEQPDRTGPSDSQHPDAVRVQHRN